jgi:hypothetical protein
MPNDKGHIDSIHHPIVLGTTKGAALTLSNSYGAIIRCQELDNSVAVMSLTLLLLAVEVGLLVVHGGEVELGPQVLELLHANIVTIK